MRGVTARQHLQHLEAALRDLHGDVERIDRWGAHVAEVLITGGRLLAAGNGGSAAHAQHLTAELVGRYLDERRPLSAIALHADTSSVTAIVNDYGADEVFARQVRAHGRPGDVLLALSTSGRSVNVLAAVSAAHELGMTVYAFTGRAPCPLAGAADDALCVDGDTPTIQEVHQVAVHLLCAAIDSEVLANESSPAVVEPFRAIVVGRSS